MINRLCYFLSTNAIYKGFLIQILMIYSCKYKAVCSTNHAQGTVQKLCFATLVPPLRKSSKVCEVSERMIDTLAYLMVLWYHMSCKG